ncbi:hypothetical protein ACFWDA_20920 [Rhodococcus zopfii]|uniref:hypothetical protein n=1 Tax=Rhodococcus zopfii TaxID=43772 RepID=UPI00366A4DCE
MRCADYAASEGLEVLVRENVPGDEIDKMTHLNAMHWHSFDPFTHIPRDRATVGALRAASARARREHPAAQPQAHPAEHKPSAFQAQIKAATAHTAS